MRAFFVINALDTRHAEVEKWAGVVYQLREEERRVQSSKVIARRKIDFAKRHTYVASTRLLTDASLKDAALRNARGLQGWELNTLLIIANDKSRKFGSSCR